ncbi:MAG: argininosuccinate lyase [Gammaproteobacteria bacterium]|nr:argininosuccinate lyase [Gammaproteobacteria bacterium]
MRKKQQKKPWGGRFSAPTHALLESFSASVAVDRRLYRHDIRGSIAHARMLMKIGVLTEDEFNAIESGLKTIQDDIERGAFEWDDSLEDVHMNIEAQLTARIGDAGKKLHTARSRNDQVATDMRLYLRDAIDQLCAALTKLQRAIVQRAAAEAATIMPGFTHLQSAQPVTFGHHLLAWNEMLERDYARLRDCRVRVNVSPLGGAALAGSGLGIDREMTAAELEFAGVCRNSLDAVSDRDFAIEFAAAVALLMVHLSRVAEEIVLWCSSAFGFVDLSDAFTTGSSIMPQKKNPDVAELIRGKSARAHGNLSALLMLMKAQPLAYNRDNQEDKTPLFDSADTALACVEVFTALLPAMKLNHRRMREAAARGHATATDLADYLVSREVPFREAHEAVGKAVGFAEAKGAQLDELKLAELQQFNAAIAADVFDALSVEGSVAARAHTGGTAPARVSEAARAALKRLSSRSA